jgi:hypothetical protein
LLGALAPGNQTPSDGVIANDGRYRAPPVALERQLASLKGGDSAGRNLPDGPLRLLDLAKLFASAISDGKDPAAS